MEIQITFEPTFQLFLLTNYKPEIHVNQSIERRIVLIPFLAEFKDKDNYDSNNKKHRLGDKNIELILSQKLDQLLVWLVKGSVKYFKEGLGDVPNKIKDATKEYLNENDDLGNFMEETCNKDTNGFVYTSEIYEKYTKAYEYVSQKVFTQLMKEKGYNLSKRNGYKGYKGLSLQVENNLLD